MSRDLRPGDTLPETEFSVDAWRMKVFALLMADPNPVHFDPAYVRSLGQGDRPVNQGTLTAALPLNVLIAWLGGDDAVARRLRQAGSLFTVDAFRARQLLSGVAGGAAGIAVSAVLAQTTPASARR